MHLEDSAGNDPYHSDCYIMGKEGSSLPHNVAFLGNSKSTENEYHGPATVCRVLSIYCPTECPQLQYNVHLKMKKQTYKVKYIGGGRGG